MMRSSSTVSLIAIYFVNSLLTVSAIRSFSKRITVLMSLCLWILPTSEKEDSMTRNERRRRRQMAAILVAVLFVLALWGWTLAMVLL